MANSIGDLQVQLSLASAKFETGLKSANQKLGGLQSAASFAGKAFAGLFAASSVKQVIDIADGFQQTQLRIKSATGSAKEYAVASARLYEISQATATELSSNVALFQRLKIGAAELGRSDQDVLRLAESINKLGLLGGATQTELGNASTQLSQALAGGIVRAEEFNSIVENTPILAKAIADGLGVSVGEMRKLVLDGKLLADDVFKSILSQTEAIDERFDAFGTTISRASSRLGGAFTAFVGQLDTATGISQKLAKWLDRAAQSMERAASIAAQKDSLLQADTVAAARNEYAELAAEIDRLKKSLANSPVKALVNSTIDDKEQQLKVLLDNLRAEEDKLAILRGQYLLSNSSLSRLGMPTVDEPAAPAAKARLSVVGGTASAADAKAAAKAAMKARESDLKDALRMEEEYQSRLSAAQSGLDSTTSGLQTAQERVNAEYDARMMAIQTAKALEIETKIAYDELEIRAAVDRENQLTEIDRQATEARIELAEEERMAKMNAMQGLFGGLATLMNTGSEKLFKVGKMAAITKATIDGYLAIQSALANVPYPFNIAAAAGMAVMTASNIASIKSQQFGGGGTVSMGGGTPGIYRPSQPTIPNTAPGASSAVTPTSREKITIINQTTGRVDRVTETQISPTERALLLEEAESRVASSVMNPNSRISRNIAAATTSTRVR